MGNRRFDVVALGEVLIDFTSCGMSEQGNPIFEANPGGAPCNVLAMLRKLGRCCAFVGKTGDDLFGHQLQEAIKEAGISTDYLVQDEGAHTTLAFVKTLPGGDRDFSFYRDPGADMLLTAAEVSRQAVSDCCIFHFGSLSMTHEEVRKATQQSVCWARASGAWISFDPNLRLPLWPNAQVAREQIGWGLAHCDILKIADDELIFMTGEQDLDRGAAVLQRQYPNLQLLNVTAGAEGSYCFWNGLRVFMPAVRLPGVIDTTGAGDTFCACVLNAVLEHGLSDWTETRLGEMLCFANTAAYLVTTKKGAIRSMPEREQVEQLLADTAFK